MPYPGQQLGMKNVIDRETRKVGKGGTENGPAILPIANSFEIFCLDLLSIHKQCLYMDNFSAIFSPH